MALWCADIETTGILKDMRKQEKPLLHNFGAKNPRTGEKILFSRSKNNLDQLQAFLDEGHTLVIHNGIPFDGEALSMLGYDGSKCEIIDTLGLSWYLYPKLKRHGLAYWGEALGFPKPPIDDWENLTPEEYDVRVMGDVEIQTRLWEHFNDLLNKLYDTFEGKKRLIDYLNFKMELQRLQQIYRWTLDIPECERLFKLLTEEKANKLEELAGVMPRVPIKAKRTRPAKPFKMDGTLSATGERWDALTKEQGLPFDYDGTIVVTTGDRDPNPGSHAQIKDWLFSLGWEPETFDYKRDKATGDTRAIPQVGHKKGGGRLCDSVERILDKHPDLGLEHLRGLGILTHRISILNGFLRDVDEDGTITAGCNGFTNTLRLKHSVLVNLPSTRVLWGKEIRGLLSTPKGYKNIGSDLASLEDRCKHHFQWQFDPEYVKMQMADDYDPHLQVCIMGGLLTEKQVEEHKENGKLPKEEQDKSKDQSGVRHLGKGGNYACQYGAGVETLMRQLGIDLKTATAVRDGYWKLNHSIKKIANAVKTKKCNGSSWLWNPVSKLWYWLKADKDKFSTLCQGLGAYIFDMWAKAINEEVKRRYGVCMPFAAQFHDELVLIVKEGTFHIWEDILKKAVHGLADELKLNRQLDCDVQEDDTYAGIH